MIKQVAGKKINIGVGAQATGLGTKPSLVSQDLIAQFSKLVEEISAQMELINEGVEGKGRSIKADSVSERQAQNGLGQGTHLGQESMIGMGAVSSRTSSKDMGDSRERFEEDSKSADSRQSVQGSDSKVDAKGVDVPSTREDNLSGRASRGSVTNSQEDGQRSDARREAERDINAEQGGQELDAKDNRQPGSTGQSGANAESLGLTTAEQSSSHEGEELASPDVNPNPSISTAQAESKDGKGGTISSVREVDGQSINAQAMRSRDGDLSAASANGDNDDSLVKSTDDTSQSDDQDRLSTIKGASDMAPGAPAAPLSPDVQTGRGGRANLDQKGPSGELNDGLSSQDEQLLGALREQAGQRVQETAANNHKLAKAIFERLAGDSGRGDLNVRALDGAAGASSSSAMLGDTLGRLSQGEKFLPRKDRVLLSQGVQLRTMERIEQALKEVERSKDGKSISIRLDPPNLGHVRTDITLNDGVLYARFVPENRDVAQLLKERASELQTILKRAGFDADRVQISVSSDSLNEQGRGNEQRTGSGSSFEGQTSGEQLFQRQGYQGEGGTDSGKDGWRERGFEQNIGLGAGRAGSKTDDHWVA